VTLLLVGLGFFVFLVLARLLRPIFVAATVGSALDDLGRKALDEAVDAITLNRLSGADWKEVESLCAPLLTRGFTDGGAYSIDKMPGVRVRMLLNAADGIVAQVWEHPKVGSWVEIVTYYHDGRVFTATTMPAIPVPHPPWISTVRAPGASPPELLERTLRERPSGIVKKVTAASAPRDFEAGYVAAMAWTKERRAG
jgi:hypothetical protein